MITNLVKTNVNFWHTTISSTSHFLLNYLKSFVSSLLKNEWLNILLENQIKLENCLILSHPGVFVCGCESMGGWICIMDVWMCTCICAFMHIHVYVSLCVHPSACVIGACVCVIGVCVCVRVCVRVRACACVRACVHVRVRVCVRMHARRACACACARICKIVYFPTMLSMHIYKLMKYFCDSPLKNSGFA